MSSGEVRLDRCLTNDDDADMSTNPSQSSICPATDGPAASATSEAGHHHLFPALLSSLDARSDAVGFIGPNWFASVMGTGIVANAAATLPMVSGQLHGFAVGVWVLAAGLLVVLTGAAALHLVRYPSTARGHARDPMMAQFFGAPPMALMTVGTGTLLLGSSVIGRGAAVDVDWVLWSLGTLLGLVTAAAIPYLLFTQHEVRPDAAFGDG